MTIPILYHCPDARSLRCLWAAVEAGVDVDLRLLKFPPRAFEPDYRAVNPLMTIPGWVEGVEHWFAATFAFAPGLFGWLGQALASAVVGFVVGGVIVGVLHLIPRKKAAH